MLQTNLWRKSKHIFCPVTFFYPENRAVCEIGWKNTVKPDIPQVTVWRMRITRWKPNATNTHSEYVILIAFLLQQWLHEHASMLRYTYIACLVMSNLHYGEFRLH